MEHKNGNHAPVTDVRSAAETHRTSNIVFKIISVIFAVSLWFYAQSVNNPTSESVISDVPIRVINVADEALSVMSSNELTVDLTVRGKKKDLNKLTMEQFTVVADASGIERPGEYSLRPEVTSKPDGVTVTAKSASIVQVYLDVRRTEEFPVTVRLSDYMLNSVYEMGDPVPSVETVRVTGPSSLLDRISFAQIPISWGGQQINGSIRASGQVILLDSNGQQIKDNSLSCDVSDVEVLVPVTTYRDVPLKVTTVNGYFNESNTQITIEPATVRLKGEPSVLEAFTSITLPAIDETKITTGSVNLPVTVPDGLVNVDGVTSATVTIRHKGTVTADVVIQKDEFSVYNPSAYSYTVLTDRIPVKLRMPSGYATNLTDTVITIKADFSGMEQPSGRMEVPVSISVTAVNGAVVYPVGDYYITVRFD